MFQYMIWFVFHICIILVMLFPAYKGLKVPTSSTPMVPLSFMTGSLLLYFELYGIFLLANSIYVLYNVGTAFSFLFKPPNSLDAEEFTQIATLAGLRTLMTLATIMSTQFV